MALIAPPENTRSPQSRSRAPNFSCNQGACDPQDTWRVSSKLTIIRRACLLSVSSTQRSVIQTPFSAS